MVSELEPAADEGCGKDVAWKTLTGSNRGLFFDRPHIHYRVGVTQRCDILTLNFPSC